MKATFPISKRVFLSVYEHPDVARAELRHWFSTVYHNPDGIDASGIHGTPEQLRARIEGLVALGEPLATQSRLPVRRATGSAGGSGGSVKAVEEVAKRLPARIDGYHVGVIDPLF